MLWRYHYSIINGWSGIVTSKKKREQAAYHSNPDRPVSEDEVSNRIRLLMTLRTGGISDINVLAAMENIPRELFVEEAFNEHAWDDTALPIACGQTISQPTVVAWMTAALEVEPRMRVLEIGTGSGYQTAILARLARRVYTVERHPELLAQAEERFGELKLTNIVIRKGDGSKGWKEAAPFERIMVTAAAAEVPATLLDQLSPGGIMVLPVGNSVADQILLRIRKAEDGAITTQHLMNVRFVPLVEDK